MGMYSIRKCSFLILHGALERLLKQEKFLWELSIANLRSSPSSTSPGVMILLGSILAHFTGVFPFSLSLSSIFISDAESS